MKIGTPHPWHVASQAVRLSIRIDLAGVYNVTDVLLAGQLVHKGWIAPVWQNQRYEIY